MVFDVILKIGYRIVSISIDQYRGAPFMLSMMVSDGVRTKTSCIIRNLRWK